MSPYNKIIVVVQINIININANNNRKKNKKAMIILMILIKKNYLYNSTYNKKRTEIKMNRN